MKNNSDSLIRDLTEGNIPRLLLSFAAPLFFSNALQAVYNVVDMIVVGRVIGGVGMSAVATGGNILAILSFAAMGFSSAGQVIIAHSIGEKDLDSVRRTIGTMFSLLLATALCLSVCCYLLRTVILDLMNVPQEARGYTLQYMVICLTGLPFIYGYNIVSAIMRGMGDSRRPFIFVALASIMNILLDLLFIAVLHMEVMGAALATVIGQSFSFLYAIFYLYRNRIRFGFDFSFQNFLPDRKTAENLCSLGIPMAIQYAAINTSMTVVAAWVNSFGIVASALSGILHKLNTMMGVMRQALTTAAASMVSQNLGARKYSRVPRILFCAFACAALIQTIFVMILLTRPMALFGLFTNDTAILSSTSLILLPSILSAYAAATRTFAFGLINGSGNSRLNLIIAVLDGMICRICLAYYLGWFLGMGPKGFWIGEALAGYMPIMIGGSYYLSGRWKSCQKTSGTQCSRG